MNTRYTVEKRDGCTLVSGKLPLADMSALMLGLAKEDPRTVMDHDLARVADVGWAFGNPEACAALKATLAGDGLARVKREHPALSDAATQWLATGEQGASALAMFDRLVEAGAAKDGQRDAYPHDPDDLRRCRLLLEQVPEARAGFASGMGEASPAWRVLVEHWNELCACMDGEAPEWRNRGGEAKETYRRMCALLEPLERRPSGRRP